MRLEMTTTELVAMLKRDPELEVQLTARDTLEVGFGDRSS